MASSKLIILITGANSGVGYAASKVICSNSSHYHVIVASRDLEKGEAAVADLESLGLKGSLSSIHLDLTDEDSIKSAAAYVEQQFGRLDVLINNAAMARNDSNIKSQFQAMLNTNVIGTILVTEAFRPLLLKSRRACVINVSSALGSLARAANPTSVDYRYKSVGSVGYRVSKAALNMFVIESSKDFEDHGVRVFAVCPGLVVSNLRGTSDEQRSAGGAAGDPEVSGQTILAIIQGKRDADAGKFVYKDGVYPW